MQAKSFFLAAVLIAAPAAAFAQSAPMQNSAPDSAMPDQSSPPASSAMPAGAVVPATPADLTVNAVVNDASGAKVGTIESVTSAGAVVSTGTARAQIPAASFSKNANGLVIGMTKAQLEAAVAKAAAPKP